MADRNNSPRLSQIVESIYEAITGFRPKQYTPVASRVVNLDMVDVDDAYLDSLAREFTFREIDRKGPLDLSQEQLHGISPAIAHRARQAVLDSLVEDETIGHATWGSRLVHYRFKFNDGSYRLRITYIS